MCDVRCAIAVSKYHCLRRRVNIFKQISAKYRTKANWGEEEGTQLLKVEKFCFWILVDTRNGEWSRAWWNVQKNHRVRVYITQSMECTKGAAAAVQPLHTSLSAFFIFFCFSFPMRRFPLKRSVGFLFVEWLSWGGCTVSHFWFLHNGRRVVVISCKV